MGTSGSIESVKQASSRVSKPGVDVATMLDGVGKELQCCIKFGREWEHAFVFVGASESSRSMHRFSSFPRVLSRAAESTN